MDEPCSSHVERVSTISAFPPDATNKNFPDSKVARYRNRVAQIKIILIRSTGERTDINDQHVACRVVWLLPHPKLLMRRIPGDILLDKVNASDGKHLQKYT